MSADPTAVGRVPGGAPVDEQHESETLSGYLRLWWQGVKAGDLGTLPIIIGLVLILLTFGILEENFLTERNLTNLLLQTAAYAAIAIGVVFVLLIGEIDLSVAYVSAVGAVVMTLLLRPDDPGWPWWVAIPIALLCTTLIVLQTVGLAAVTFAAVWYLNADRGVPQVMLILGIFLLFWSFVASRTRFGRHVYAVGGSAEAARRAGIAVDRVRIAVFMISGFMAGVGGIILASRLRSVATNTGGGNLLLLVIAAAVVGGTSLFGGTGRVIAALLGALVIASIQNGMDLMGLASGTKFVITGLVLLGAVLVDAFSKRRRAARGGV